MLSMTLNFGWNRVLNVPNVQAHVRGFFYLFLRGGIENYGKN